MKILFSFLTRERVLGVVQHLMTWVAGWLIAHNYLLAAYTPSIVGAGLAIASILWSIYSGGKTEPVEVWGGILRHVLTFCSAIAISKGWIGEDMANKIILAILSLLGPSLSMAAPEKIVSARARRYGSRL